MITYLKGDATQPIETGCFRIVAHVVNNVGVWGAGFVLSVTKRWPQVEANYRRDYRFYPLGTVQYVAVGRRLTVANMVAQRGVGVTKGGIPLQYDELERCLALVQLAASKTGASIHMPRIGTGLAGGEWKEVEKRIRAQVSVPVFVYDLA